MRTQRLDLLRSLVAEVTAEGDPIVALLQRAAARAAAQGLVVLPLGLQAAEDLRELGATLLAIARQGLRDGHAAAPTLILSGGVALRAGQPLDAAGQALSLALLLDALPNAYTLVAGAVPGTPGVWGGLLAPDSLLRARAQGLRPEQLLDQARSAEFFAALGDQFALPGCGSPAAGAAVRALLLA
jgi:hydroxypyruvate reductase